MGKHEGIMKLTSGYFKTTAKYRVGVGGPFCSCCTKMPPNVMKIKVRRMIRRKSKMEIMNHDC